VYLQEQRKAGKKTDIERKIAALSPIDSNPDIMRIEVDGEIEIGSFRGPLSDIHVLPLFSKSTMGDFTH
jgi:hypothetical protein